MIYAELSMRDKIAYAKKEFSGLVRVIFDNPETLKQYITDKRLSNDQSKSILSAINKLNSKTCSCCRRFDISKLQMTPIEKELEPILDIAQVNVKKRDY